MAQGAWAGLNGSEKRWCAAGRICLLGGVGSAMSFFQGPGSWASRGDFLQGGRTSFLARNRLGRAVLLLCMYFYRDMKRERRNRGPVSRFRAREVFIH